MDLFICYADKNGKVCCYYNIRYVWEKNIFKLCVFKLCCDSVIIVKIYGIRGYLNRDSYDRYFSWNISPYIVA